jgi:hypothetical protein
MQFPWRPFEKFLTLRVSMYELLDYVFHIIHLTVIVINTTFWMSFRTLRIAQTSLMLTILSWFGCGTIYGFGYCFLTDWHWQIKQQMGDTNLPSSYIKLILDRTTGSNWDPKIIESMTMFVLIFSVAGCLIQTLKYVKQKSSI